MLKKKHTLRDISRELRKSQTETENILWENLRNNKIGLKVRRQYPIQVGEYKFVTDFYIVSHRLIIALKDTLR
jgi:very-short-patch-repair endonuclease